MGSVDSHTLKTNDFLHEVDKEFLGFGLLLFAFVLKLIKRGIHKDGSKIVIVFGSCMVCLVPDWCLANRGRRFSNLSSDFGNLISTFAGSFRNGASAFSCPLCDSIRTFRSCLCNVVAPILQEFSRIGRSGANLLERIESHSPCLLQRERAEAAAVRVICPFVF